MTKREVEGLGLNLSDFVECNECGYIPWHVGDWLNIKESGYCMVCGLALDKRWLRYLKEG
ncbi:unnamed protein product [marine sediment metagenome]|uniref:Uncharacterized protein n=1 Tax=marine sediment metagenome TaxID=412755 RepID=X0V1R6_9ZZZZ